MRKFICAALAALALLVPASAGASFDDGGGSIVGPSAWCRMYPNSPAKIFYDVPWAHRWTEAFCFLGYPYYTGRQGTY